MPSLYAAGWRQGSIARAAFEVAVVGADGPRPEVIEHWMVVTQDCDLAQADVDDDIARRAVELRPIRNADPPTDLGIRSRRFLLRRGAPEHLCAEDPRLHVTPLALAGAELADTLDADRTLALRTWLRLRYDRPAVPDVRVELMRALADLVGRHRKGGEVVHDVLVQATDDVLPEVSVYAVIEDGGDVEVRRAEVRRWLATLTSELDPALGIVSAIEVGTKGEVSLALIEASWSADTSQITWGKGAPRGAP